LFDFDGTLTRRDTLWPLGELLASLQRGRRQRLGRLAAQWVSLKLRLSDNQGFKECFARLLLAGVGEADVASVMARFHHTFVEPHLNRVVFRQLGEHRAAGDQVCLVSSNFEFVLRPLRAPWGLREIIATETVVSAGVFSGELRGPACHGEEKVRRVLARFGEEPMREAVAYGDGRDDVHLLRAVRRGYWVRGDQVRVCT
jgi:HAD superfamily hydrolase (TIGR01490 family)